jgi:F420-dependent oxidoreductase-like protein
MRYEREPAVIELALMVEGQNGLNWDRWRHMARAAEDFGFVGLYRSDHYTNMAPPDLDSLELWVSLSWLATATRRIEFGPLVTPVSFRHPTMTARMAAAVDDLCGGRLTLGIGAGWQEREHNNYGHDLLPLKDRFDRFEEGAEVISRLLRSEQPVTFSGKYYRLHDAIVLPRPVRPSGPPILIGGSGEKRTLPLVAQYADEWNSVFTTPSRFKELNAKLNELLIARGRQPQAVRRSVMTGCFFGKDDAAFRRKLEKANRPEKSAAEMNAKGIIAGTPNEVIDQLNERAQAGVQRIMLQWLDLDDIDGIEAMASTVLPQVS